jgi:hypothetical protein
LLAGLSAGIAAFSVSTAPATPLEPALPPNDPSAALLVHLAVVRTLAVRSFTMVSRETSSNSSGQGVQTIVYQAPDRVDVSGGGIQQVFVGSTTYFKVPVGSPLSGPGGEWTKTSSPSRIGVTLAQEWLMFVSDPDSVQRVAPDVFRVETVRAVAAAPRPFTIPAGYAEVVLTVTIRRGKVLGERGTFSAPGLHEDASESVAYSRFDSSPPVTTPAEARSSKECGQGASTSGFVAVCGSATYSTP